jgi:hypothetical protein
MRRAGVIVALGALLGMLGGVVTAARAFADRGPKRHLNAGQPFTLPADFCGFQIGVSFPSDKEYLKVLKAAPDRRNAVSGIPPPLTDLKPSSSAVCGSSVHCRGPDSYV